MKSANRTIKEILILMLANLRERKELNKGYAFFDNRVVGICYIPTALLTLNSAEHTLIEDFLDSNLPPKYYVYDNGNKLETPTGTFCWNCFDFDSRIEWLQEQINKLQYESTCIV